MDGGWNKETKNELHLPSTVVTPSLSLSLSSFKEPVLVGNKHCSHYSVVSTIYVSLVVQFSPLVLSVCFVCR